MLLSFARVEAIQTEKPVPFLAKRPKRVDRSIVHVLDDIDRDAVSIASYLASTAGRHLKRVVRV